MLERLRRRVSLMDLAVLAVLIGAAVIASQYGARARLVPMIVSVGSAVLLVLQLIFQARGVSLELRGEELMGSDARKAAEAAEAKEQALAAKDGRRMVSYAGGTLGGGIVVVLGFAALILLLGMLPAVFLFVLGYLSFVGRLRFLYALGMAAATEAVVLLIFVAGLGVRMNEGYLVDWLL